MATNYLSLAEQVAVRDWLVDSRDRLAGENETREGAACRATAELGFVVTEANIRYVLRQFDNLDWQGMKTPIEQRLAAVEKQIEAINNLLYRAGTGQAAGVTS